MREKNYLEELINMGLVMLGLITFAVVSFCLNGGPELVKTLGLVD